MSGLKGNVSDIRKIAKRIPSLPTTLVAEVADKAAPVLTEYATGSFASNQTAYDDARPRGVDGRPLTLERTGLTRTSIRFVRVGSVVRCVLGPRYAKFLVGKYRILPMGRMPVKWSRRLAKLVESVQL